MLAAPVPVVASASRAVVISVGEALAKSAGSIAAAHASAETMSFHTVGFHPPRVRVTADPDRRSGDIFLAAKHLGSRVHFQRGPMILDSRGRLVFFERVNGKITNLEVQHYRGSPVLTWWESRGSRAFDVIMNRSYHVIAALHAGHGYRADSHEFQITPQGTALIDAVYGTRANLTSVGGPANGTVTDCVILELSIKTGRLLWKWNALDHIPITASYAPYRSGQRYDYLHMNSIQQLPNGNLLMSGRNTWTVYEIDKHTGRIIWSLGGKHSSFRMGPGTAFGWQHDAHLYSGGRLSLFNDGSNGFNQEASQSSGEIMRLNFGSRTATLIHRYYHRPPLVASSQGSTQILPDGNIFVGWGDQPDFSEYRPDGQQIFNGSFPFGAQSYRAYRFQWSGQPTTKPSVALSPRGDGSTRVWVSWNGATAVRSWRVVGGSSPRRMFTLGGRPRTGFETEMNPRSEPAYFEVQALGANGHVLGTSAPHSDPAHVAIFSPSAFVDKSSGFGGVAVGCFGRQTCHVSVRLSSQGSVLARSAHPVPRSTGQLIDFKLSPAGLSKLRRGAHHRLTVTVNVHDSASGKSAVRRVTLIPYSITGAGPPSHVTQSTGLQFVQGTAFVSAASGDGEILAACYGPSPCRIRTTVSVHGRRIARSGPEYLGVGELGFLHFELSSSGRALLRHARGNQLGAKVVLSEPGSASAGGSVDLVGYR